MSAPGMWMPKMKDGKNWELLFSAEIVGGINDGEKIVERRKSFRVVADAHRWIDIMKNLSVEAGQVKEPELRNFVYSSPRKIGGK